jgi:hypothetical protein
LRLRAFAVKKYTDFTDTKRFQMKTNIIINPRYSFLTQYIQQIPKHFESLTEILYKDRNVIKADEVSNVKLVIKSFHRNYLTNRIRYSFFHPSKAKRAYDNGLELIQRGFLTPEPVAFIERFEYGLLNQSFFICLRTDFTKLEFHFATGGKLLMKDLAAFTFDLHKSGTYHLDYSNGNILCKKEDDHYQFSLVDNNRMKFGKFSYHRRLENFRLLGLSHDNLVIVASEYARLENRDQGEAVEHVVRSERRHSERRKFRKRLKNKILRRG